MSSRRRRITWLKVLVAVLAAVVLLGTGYLWFAGTSAMSVQ